MLLPLEGNDRVTMMNVLKLFEASKTGSFNTSPETWEHDVHALVNTLTPLELNWVRNTRNKKLRTCQHGPAFGEILNLRDFVQDRYPSDVVAEVRGRLHKVTTPIPDGRVKLGAQVVQLLVQHGFVGPDKWKNVIRTRWRQG